MTHVQTLVQEKQCHFDRRTMHGTHQCINVMVLAGKGGDNAEFAKQWCRMCPGNLETTKKGVLDLTSLSEYAEKLNSA